MRNKPILFITIANILLVVLCISYFNFNSTKPSELAKAMYEFDPMDIDGTDARIKELVSNDLYQYITLNNNERQLYTYLKFKGNASKISIIEEGKSHVVYYYTEGAIESTRTFRLEVKMNKGVITDISEQEIYILTPNYREDWYSNDITNS